MKPSPPRCDETTDQDPMRAGRLDRLREELRDAGAWSPHLAEIAFLKEIDRARYPRRHERRFPSYGAIVNVGDDDHEIAAALDELGAIRLEAPRDAARQVRPMADGIQSFAFIRPGAAELVLLQSAVPREVELVRLRRSLGSNATLVCRSDDGVVRVVERSQIVIYDGTRWWNKPDARHYAAWVARADPGAPVETTQHILDFCVHTAGPGPGGTILVWCLDDRAVETVHARSIRTRPTLPLDLSLALPEAHSAIQHLLSQIDGATSVGPAGEVVETGLHLRPSRDAHRRVDISGTTGTRHAAAKQCSFDVTDAVFFVVSDDGPVTVYSRGHTVASITLAADLEHIPR
jgi:hypothetical protein